MNNEFVGHDQSAWELFYLQEPDQTMAVFTEQIHLAYMWRVPLLKKMAEWPRPPRPIVDVLWNAAIHGDRPSGERTYRYPARFLINTWPDARDGLRSRLKDKDAKVRIRIAEWLKDDSKLYADLASDVEAALKSEKSEQVQPYLLNTFEALGGSLEPYLNPNELEETVKGFALKAPHWIAWESAPEVKWRTLGKPVTLEALQYLVVKSLKLKEPDAMMRRYVGLMDTAQRGEFAKFILDSWLALDTDPMSFEEAEKLATSDSDKWYEQVKAFRSMQNFDRAKDIADRLKIYLSKPTGESSTSKGALWVVGTMAGPDVVPAVSSYLKQWYGTRASQCKALLNMIALMDYPASIQLLLSVRNKFRTKGIQDEAAKLIDEVVERKGWTVDELADRTIPDAGFDEKGMMELHYGKRIFTAHLGGNLKIVLKDGTGKEIKALPNPNKDDDQELASETKKHLANRQKEFKAVVELQRDRLYEAMCTQRSWVMEDWERYLLQHPIVGRYYAQSLVWAEVIDDKIARLFRPTNDGSITDVKDVEVKLSPQATIRLAHDCLIEKTVAQEWLEHLGDYMIFPPFQQFGKHPSPLPITDAEKRSLDGFEGHLIESFKLRSGAEKLGYSRGQAEDGGNFYDYVKRLPGLGITIEVGFSGNKIPEENCLVALTVLRFQVFDDEEESQRRGRSLPLKDVPPVLLAECWNDLATLSALGSGFDPNWEQMVAL